MKQHVLIVVVVLSLIISCIESADVCTSFGKDSPDCACRGSGSGYVVDLHGIAIQHITGKTGDDAYIYHYRPCEKLIDMADPCKDAFACQNKNQTKVFTPIAQEPAVSDPWNGTVPKKIGEQTLHLMYRSTDGSRKTVVTLECAVETKLTSVKENPPKTYHFVLQTERACGKEMKKGLSVGSILCIILLVGVVIYLVAGILYNRLVLGARGIELVPNLDFWKELPLLVKDGFVFVKNGCRTDSTYDQI